jgi:hypothetical protein
MATYIDNIPKYKPFPIPYDYFAYTAWLKKFIKDNLKEYETYTEEQILEALEEVENYIKLYCRIPRVPYALKYVWGRMTLDLLRTILPMEDDSGGGGSSVAPPVATGIIKEIVVGDTSFKLDADTDAATSSALHTPNMDELCFKYKDILQRFRMWQ